MHVSIVAILTMASQSVLNPSIKQGSTEPSPNSPNQEADGVVVAMVVMAVDADAVMVEDVVIAIKPSLVASGRVMLRV